MQIQTTVTCNFVPTSMALKKKKRKNEYERNWTLVGVWNGAAAVEDRMTDSKKMKQLSYDPAIPLLGRYPELNVGS
jgi:hypothetical protein